MVASIVVISVSCQSTGSAADSSGDDTSTVVVLILMLCVTIVLLIICVTILILKWRGKKDTTVGGDGIHGVGDDQQNEAQPTKQYTQVNYQPQSISHGTLS